VHFVDFISINVILNRVFKCLIYLSVVISLPTFIIAECVLIYIDPSATATVVSWASEKFSTAVFFICEQVESFLWRFSVLLLFICECPWIFGLMLFCADTS
jgi:hypothetical protein